MFLGKDQSVGATGLEGGQRREGMLALQTGSQPLCKHNNRWGGVSLVVVVVVVELHHQPWRHTSVQDTHTC